MVARLLRGKVLSKALGSLPTLASDNIAHVITPTLYFILKAKKSEGGRTAEPPASIEWSTAALALLRSVLAKHAENALQRTQCATAATTAAKGDPAQRRADQVHFIAPHKDFNLEPALFFACTCICYIRARIYTQVRKLVDAELLLLQAAIDHAEGIINS